MMVLNAKIAHLVDNWTEHTLRLRDTFPGSPSKSDLRLCRRRRPRLSRDRLVSLLRNASASAICDLLQLCSQQDHVSVYHITARERLTSCK
jgi:hypothetical protein